MFDDPARKISRDFLPPARLQITKVQLFASSFLGSKVIRGLGTTNVTSNTIMAIANLFQVQHVLRKRPGYNELFTTENQPLRRLSFALDQLTAFAITRGNCWYARFLLWPTFFENLNQLPDFWVHRYLFVSSGGLLECVLKIWSTVLRVLIL